MITLTDVTKSFDNPAGPFSALQGIRLSIRTGEHAAIVGKSGSGKSTLLNIMSGIDRATTGSVVVGGQSLRDLSPDRLARWRGRNVGIVFQFFQLLPALTVFENVLLPMDFCGVIAGRDRRRRALELLERTGVADQRDKLPSALSGGQQQRVAVARALANDPPLLLADEPTGNLDSATGAEIFRLFTEQAAAGKTVVIVTHERDSVSKVARTVTLADGRVAT